MLPYVEVLGYNIPVYTILFIAGLAVGVGMLFLLRSRRGLPKSDTLYGMLYAVMGGLVGAKVLFLLVNLEDLLHSPDPLGYIMMSGIVFYGGVIGGALALFLYCRRYRISFLAFADAAAAGLCFGQAIGRVGCFCAGCCYGVQMDTPLSVYYPEGGFAPSGVPVLATQLMEAAYLLLLGTALVLIVRRSRRVGLPAAVYMLGYGVWRFAIEFFRSDPRGSLLGLSTSQLISIGVVALGAAVLLWQNRKCAA